MPRMTALERRFPALRGRLPRFPLTTLPTPVHLLPGLGAAKGIDALWIKRDDRSGRLYGGNKPRKLEFLLGEALRRERRTVMTFGGIGTHHGLATTVCARVAGLRTILVLVPQPVTAHVQRCLLLDQAFGAELHYAASVPRAAALALRLWTRGLLRGDVPEIIPVGGTSACGTLGYVDAALELAEQVHRGELPEPAWIFVPLGSGGTAAGLVVGLRLGGLRSRVAAVLVTDILPPSRGRLALLARSAVRRLRRVDAGVPTVPIRTADFHVLRGHVGPGYGAPTAEAQVAAALMAGEEGITLETTYSAKCLAAVLAGAGRPPFDGGPLLFWNTYSGVEPDPGEGGLPSPDALPAAFRACFVETVRADDQDLGPGTTAAPSSAR